MNLLKIFEETVNDYNAYSALYHMFYSSAHDIVCVGDLLFARLSKDIVSVGNQVVSYKDARKAWKMFDETFDALDASTQATQPILIREGRNYYFYDTGEESPISFMYNGKFSNVIYRSTIADVEPLEEKGDFKLASGYGFFAPKKVHIETMKNDIVKMCII